METVQQKFNNFKAFIAQEIPGSYWLSLATGAPVNVFLKAIHDRGGDKSSAEITDIVLDMAGLTRGDFSADSVDKFHRYIEYFQVVAAQMYA